MKKFIFVVICLVLCLTTSSCNKCSNYSFDRNDTDNLYVQIVLNNGKKINLELYYDKAPITVDNFIDLVESKYYKNAIFHRVIENFMIQTGGYEMKSGELFVKNKVKSITGEFSANGWTKNDISHELGVISMARSDGYNSASSQFFICSANCKKLDGQYAAFGKTTDSKSTQVVIEISKVETYYHSNSFANMPVDVIVIKEILLSNKKF